MSPQPERERLTGKMKARSPVKLVALAARPGVVTRDGDSGCRGGPWMSPFIRCCLVLLVCLVGVANAAAAGEHKRVMILHSFGREFKPWNEYAKAIRAELEQQSSWTLDVEEHS